MLVFFALFFLAFFGLFAVVVDWGIARATQVQMQTSADAAALLGLAGRDAVLDDAMAADLLRRQEASIAAALVFDEDLDRGTGPDQFRLGAGPLISTGVVSSADPAGGLLETDGAWVPALATNVVENFAYGDLVSGDYEAIDESNPGRIDWHAEASDYGRLDFDPATPSSAPPRSFLARLRRTRADQPLDRVTGVSTAGPTLPYLFGLGSAALVPVDADAYDPRRDGMTVRAVAIADARPVTMAGLARPGVTGLVPFAGSTPSVTPRWLSLEESDWTAIGIDTLVVLEVNPSGIVTGGVPGLAAAGEPRVAATVSAGLVDVSGAGGSPGPLAGLMYASLHALDGTGVEPRIQGFVALELESASFEPGPLLRLTVRKLGATVAPRNASALPSLSLDRTLDPSLPEAAGGLFAAVLAR
ncbi:MAG: hypothetical protein AAGG01_02645 [Planctomycetota bacterium]